MKRLSWGHTHQQTPKLPLVQPKHLQIASEQALASALALRIQFLALAMNVQSLVLALTLLLQMNDHLVVLIYLSAARLLQQRLAGRQGGCRVVSSFVLEVMHEWGGRGEQSQGPRPICAITLYSSSVVSQSTPRAVTLSRCTAASQAACCYHFIPSAHSQHQQAPAAGGQGWGPPCRGLRREALARCRQMRRTWAVTCCIAHAQCWSAGPATAVICSRFLWESSRFHSREFGNGKWPGFPGTRETGAQDSTPYSQHWSSLVWRAVDINRSWDHLVPRTFQIFLLFSVVCCTCCRHWATHSTVKMSARCLWKADASGLCNI